jgi:ATP-dependent DNA helicase RecG
MNKSTLLKILEHEANRKFDDRAVAGGMKALAAKLQADTSLRREGVPVHTIVGLLRRYSNLGVEQRRECLRQVMALLQDQGVHELPDLAQCGGVDPSVGELGEGPKEDELPKELLVPVAKLPGVTSGVAKRLRNLGVQTVWDLLNLYPRRYDDFSVVVATANIQPGRPQTVVGEIWDVGTRRAKSGLPVTTAVISDGLGAVEAVWFNQPYLERALKRGMKVALSGDVISFGGRWTMQSPEWEPAGRLMLNTGRIVPVYPLTSGLSVRTVRRLVWQALEAYLSHVPDPLPEGLRRRYKLADLRWSLRQIHFPDSLQDLEQARWRLAFEELLTLQLALMLQKHRWQHELPAKPVRVEAGMMESAISALPFKLTGAQLRSLREVLEDMGREVPMNRLLQGDVGSGKTVVAALVMLAAHAAGYQSALMAPTEVLAEQHFATLTELYRVIGLAQGLPVPAVVLLTGSTPKREKEVVLQQAREGSVEVVVGTHALIQSEVEFRALNLVVIDEQHRFGVVQRAALRQKGYNPHVLVMTATPIPRTLALTIYKELDISVIDELPPGRQRVITRVYGKDQREAGYNLIRAEVRKGRQAFVICPLIEESPKLQVKAAVAEHKRLSTEVFPEFRVGLLHGRMSGLEKDAVMEAFRRGELDILVSTAVIEVGIDVPNATVMAIEAAERFGLAQLHQFRGRVGRGEHQSYCLLFSEAEASYNERLRVIETVYDGFRLAEEDLKLRGPGEFLGLRQSGLPELRLADLGDMRLLREVSSAAEELFDKGMGLERQQLRLLKRRVEALISPRIDLS